MSSAQLKKFSSIKPADLEWRDGLPYSREFEDIYFSIDGGIDESRHVFLQGNQLPQAWFSDQKDFYIAELGFGSGLNFLLTAFEWQKFLQDTSSSTDTTTSTNKAKTKNQHKQLHYVAFEKRPFLAEDFARAALHWPELTPLVKQFQQKYPSIRYGRQRIVFSEINLTLDLFLMPIEDAFKELLDESKSRDDANKITIDHWFLDGFAPQKNTSMWSDKVAKAITQLSKVESRFATYSVAGAVKNPLRNAGFELQKKPGFGRKREMLTGRLTSAIKPEHLPQSINLKYDSPWFKRGLQAQPKRVAIIGAGIAGCTIAYQLAKRGIAVDIYDSGASPASGASAAAAGIFHPQLTPDLNIASQLQWQCYRYLCDFLADLSADEKQELIISQGVTRLFDDEDKLKQVLDLIPTLDASSQSMQADKNGTGLYFADAAAINIKAFCQLLICKIPQQQINLNFETQVIGMNKVEQGWQLQISNKELSETVQSDTIYSDIVYCGGAESPLVRDLLDGMVRITRGQTCRFHSIELSEKVTHSLSEKNYLVPQGDGEFIFGSSFEDYRLTKQQNAFDKQLNGETQTALLKQLQALLIGQGLPSLNEAALAELPVKGSLGYRLHSFDHLPLVGAAADKSKLQKDFANLGQKRISRDSLSYYNQPGLWLNTAYGSHGLLYSMLASDLLASQMCNQVSPLTLPLANSLQPVRFVIKKLQGLKS